MQNKFHFIGTRCHNILAFQNAKKMFAINSFPLQK